MPLYALASLHATHRPRLALEQRLEKVLGFHVPVFELARKDIPQLTPDAHEQRARREPAEMSSIAPESAAQSDLFYHREFPKTLKRGALVCLCWESLGVFYHSEVAEQSAGFRLCQIPDDPRVSALPTVVAQTLPAKVVLDLGVPSSLHRLTL